MCVDEKSQRQLYSEVKLEIQPVVWPKTRPILWNRFRKSGKTRENGLGIFRIFRKYAQSLEFSYSINFLKIVETSRQSLKNNGTFRNLLKKDTQTYALVENWTNLTMFRG